MAIAFPTQARAAGTYSSPAVSVNRLKDHDIQVTGVGLSAADLADATFHIVQQVEANDAAGGNPNGWYVIYGPDDWNGGQTNKFDGTPIPPGFYFHNSAVPDAAVRMRLTVTSSRAATWGFNATVV
jgi:hypothetical protein